MYTSGRLDRQTVRPFSRCSPRFPLSPAVLGNPGIHACTGRWLYRLRRFVRCVCPACFCCVSLITTVRLCLWAFSVSSPMKAYSGFASFPIGLVIFLLIHRVLYIFLKPVIYLYFLVCSLYFTFFLRADAFKFLIYIWSKNGQIRFF